MHDLVGLHVRVVHDAPLLRAVDEHRIRGVVDELLVARDCEHAVRERSGPSVRSAVFRFAAITGQTSGQWVYRNVTST